VIGLALVALQLAAVRPSAAPVRTQSVEPPQRHIIVIDAGHGGPDNGMTGPLGGGAKLTEKTITLAVAKRLGAMLQLRGDSVVYTRTKDTLIALSDRGRIANEAKGDLFISIHVNAANPDWKSPAGARGFETYFLSVAKTEDERRLEELENASSRFETPKAAASGDAVSFILADMYQNQYLRESSLFAETVQKTLDGVHPGPNRGVKQAGFRVLVTAFMPAVLVEIGFGSNPTEANYLRDPLRQAELARSIADAAVAYLRERDRRQAGSSR
jgi:N-acetylmuramoyl-L-alanine amidase